MFRIAMVALFVGILSFAGKTPAQMIQTTIPFQNLDSSYFESNSLWWALQGPNWSANFGGNGPLLPPFAGPEAVGGGLSGGFGFTGGKVSGNLGFNFAQGSNRSISSTTGTLTTMDGVPGSLQSGVLRPFVTGVTPVVRGFAPLQDPTAIVGQTRAAVEQQQWMRLRQSQAVLQNRKLEQYLRRAQLAEEEGNKRMLRANYRSAIAIAPEPLRSQLQLRLQEAMKR